MGALIPPDREMDQKALERRRELRYPLEANAILRKENGECLRAKAVDISSSGMQLELDQPALLEPEEVVTVELELAGQPDKPLSSWGVGRIAHLNSKRIGVELFAGRFACQAEIEDAHTSEGN